jgi:hypothetical protein
MNCQSMIERTKRTTRLLIIISALCLLALLASPLTAFAQIEKVSEAHRQALIAVKEHKLPPPFVAWSFAAANTAALQAFEATRGSWLAYQTAFYRTWSILLDRELPALTELKVTALNESQRSEIRVGLTEASKLLRKMGPALKAATEKTAKDLDREFMGSWRPTPPEYAPALFPQWRTMPLWGAVATEDLQKGLAPLDWRGSTFKRELLEVASIGDAKSSERTLEQTQIAHFWAAERGTVTPPGMWIEIALSLLERGKRPAQEAASVMLILSQALSDAGVSCWSMKYGFNIWRPVTAIRDLLPGHRDWTPLLDTPPFPGYVSGHSTFSSASATVLQTLLNAGPISAKSEGLPNVIRRYSSLWAAAEEAGKSRVYGGIHFDSDNRDGLELGHRVGCSVLRKAGRSDCKRYVQY